MSATFSSDTRVFCTDCRHLTKRKLCGVVERGEWIGNDAISQPPLDVPAHCVHFEPLPGRADRRTGRERFPHEWARRTAAAEAH